VVNGRRVVHGRDFKEAERKFPFYDQWIAWEKENMGRLILNARRRMRKSKSNNNNNNNKKGTRPLRGLPYPTL
jgi:hypothetical protein